MEETIIKLNAVELLEETGILHLKIDAEAGTLDFSTTDGVKTVKFNKNRVLQLASQLTELASFIPAHEKDLR